MKLGKWPKFHKLHIYALSTPGGRNRAYFCSTGTGFRDTDQFLRLPYLGMKLGKWPKSQMRKSHEIQIPDFVETSTPFVKLKSYIPGHITPIVLYLKQCSVI